MGHVFFYIHYLKTTVAGRSRLSNIKTLLDESALIVNAQNWYRYKDTFVIDSDSNSIKNWHSKSSVVNSADKYKIARLSQLTEL